MKNFVLVLAFLLGVFVVSTCCAQEVAPPVVDVAAPVVCVRGVCGVGVLERVVVAPVVVAERVVRAPVVVAKRVVRVPVEVVKRVAQPVRKVLAVRPVRKVLSVRPVRKALAVRPVRTVVKVVVR